MSTSHSSPSHSRTHKLESALSLADARALWLGDSIAQNGLYVSFVEYFLARRFPEYHFDIISIGLSSETVSGLSEPNHPFPRPHLLERLQRALNATNPSVVIAGYGVNCGIYHPPSEPRFAAFKEGVRSLQAAVAECGAHLILLTPTPFDALPVKNLRPHDAAVFGSSAPFEGYDAVLAEFAAWEMTLASPEVTVIDLHSAINSTMGHQRLSRPDFTFCPDGIHPDAAGHLLMARTILHALHVPVGRGALQAEVARIEGDPLWKLVSARRQLRSEGWLPFIGYTRDQTVTAPSVAEIERQAALVQGQIDQIRREAQPFK